MMGNTFIELSVYFKQELTPDEIRKKLRRRQQNKDAARRCRAKKKSQENTVITVSTVNGSCGPRHVRTHCIPLYRKRLANIKEGGWILFRLKRLCCNFFHTPGRFSAENKLMIFFHVLFPENKLLPENKHFTMKKGVDVSYKYFLIVPENGL